MMHTYQEKGEILAQEPYSKAQKTVASKQGAILVPAILNRF